MIARVLAGVRWEGRGRPSVGPGILVQVRADGRTLSAREPALLEPGRLQPEPGPIASAIAIFFTFLAPVAVLGAYNLRPNMVMLIGLMPIGALLLLNREVLSSLRVSLPLVGYVGWAVASLTWAESFDQTLLSIRVFITAIIAMSVVAAYLPREVFLHTLTRSMQFIIVLTLFGVVATPSGRSVAQLDGLDVSGGWRGFFGHKNLMSPVIVLATIQNLAFEKNRNVAMSFLAMSTVLMLGAQSVTGLAAFVVGVAAWYWTGLLSNTDLRGRSIVRVATTLIGVVIVGAVLSIVGSLLDAFGKDLTFSGRTDIWELSWPIIAEQPIQGYGLSGPYGDLRSQVSLQFFIQLKFYIQHAHNALIDLLATLGIVGLVLVLTLIVGCFRAAFRTLDRDPMLARWVIASLIAMLFMGFSENLFSASYLMLVAAMRISLMVEAGLAPRDDAVGVSATLARDL